MRNPKAGPSGAAVSVPEKAWGFKVPVRVLEIDGLDTDGGTSAFHGYSGRPCRVSCFRSVVVITFASHAKGPRFETGRKQTAYFLPTPLPALPPLTLPRREVHSDWQNQKVPKARGEADHAAVGGVGDHLEVYSALGSSPPFSAPSPCESRPSSSPGGAGRGRTRLTSSHLSVRKPPRLPVGRLGLFHVFTDCL
ncbi:unnamed protein product [Rangifer tarandus platyrhynchus]|uniref:Uncharacterized protein n=1 Tax=Rangifer tarandus platyrhynchus TaxID=3082113 RepID=A0ABN8XQA7_RANTA|nr:unnamed protein product [Rangifer tarandus platyrhynchus]